MEKGHLLATSSAGVVARCPGGRVHVSIPGVSLHMTELDFLAVSRLMQEASTCLMDDSLKTLLDDS